MANHLFESITIVLGQADFDVSPKEDTIKIANVWQAPDFLYT